MKHVVILMDGSADNKIGQLGNRSALQAAKKPTIDYLASHGQVGMVNTIPGGMAPGSDVANLSVMGYDPKKFHTGRSPLEAASMGLKLKNSDIAFRCNLVTLSGGKDYSQRKMIDHSSGEITSKEAEKLIKSISDSLGTKRIKFYPGVGYRHIIIWKNGSDKFNLTPPHDILGKNILEYLPSGKESNVLLDFMERSIEILKCHPVNKDRKKRGLREADSIWIWGQGKKPQLESFYDKYKVSGSVVSAVDLIKGIGIYAGLNPVKVKGATGNINTNFTGKAKAAIKELENVDFVYLHVEAPDECSHQGDAHCKVKSIEIIDKEIIKAVFDYLKKSGNDFKIMVLPDHPTPISIRTHTSDPVPFLIYDSQKENSTSNVFDEFYPKKNEIIFEKGYKLLDYFLKKDG